VRNPPKAGRTKGRKRFQENEQPEKEKEVKLKNGKTFYYFINSNTIFFLYYFSTSTHFDCLFLFASHKWIFI